MRQLNKEGSFSVSWGSKTPEPIQLKFGVLDDIHCPTPHAIYGGTRGGSGRGRWVKLYPRVLYYYYAPPLGLGALSDDARLTSVCLRSDVCLSVAYIASKPRTERPRKRKIGTDVAHVTRDSDTTFSVKRSKVNLQGRGHIVAQLVI